MQWAWVNGGEQRAYEYDYDKLGMLRNADMHEKLPEFKNHYEQYDNFAERNITYDLNGNILTLTRSTGPSVENPGNPGPTAVDNLKYAYKGNQLSELEHNNASGSVAESGKFGYSYDKNGNMISDARKNLFLQYNYLNLLQKAAYYENMPNGDRRLIQSATYTYLADGTKASVVDKDGNGYSYLGSLTYKRFPDGSLKLESATHGSGRIVVKDNPDDPTKRVYENQYYITDHLGSIRVVFNQKGEVLARNDYYPFGKQHDNPTLTAATTFGTSGTSETPGTSTNPADNRFLYNGKENQLTGNLGFLDYGWRMYDSEGCRWLSPDPKAEKYNRWSPYNYSTNNPVRFIDPDGKKIVDAKGRILFRNGQWTQFASADVMRMGNSLRNTKAGIRQFNKLVNHPAGIQLVLNKTDVPQGYSEGSITLGELTPIVNYYPDTGKASLNSGIITIYEKSLIMTAIHENTSVEAQLAATMGHEVEHTSNANIRLQYGNARLKENNNAEEGPETVEAEIKKEFEERKPILNDTNKKIVDQKITIFPLIPSNTKGK